MLVSGLSRFGISCADNESQTKTVLLRARSLRAPVPEQLFHPKISSLTKEKRDTLTEGFTNLATLKALGVISGSWITVISQKSNGDSCSRAVRLFSLNQSTEKALNAEKYIYLSPNAMFNLNISDDNLIEVSTKCQRSERVVSDMPKLARRVTIARVRCPGSSGYAEYGEALRNFFSVQRVVAVGDVISVPIPMKMKLEASTEGSETLDNGGPDSSSGISQVHSENPFVVAGQLIPTPTALVHFQVTDLYGSSTAESAETVPLDFDESCFEGMLIDGIGGLTMMAQAGAVNSRVPNPHKVRVFLENEVHLHNKSSREQDIPLDSVFGTSQNEYQEKSALVSEEYLNQLNQLVLPRAVTNRSASGVGAAVLLCGAKGTGKDILVEAVAERYGLQLKEVSLTPLRGLPEERAAKRLKHIFSEVEQVAPCIVHLRHLHALAPVANGSEAPIDPDQVVNVLKAFIQRCTGIDSLLNPESVENSSDMEKTIIVIASTEVADETPAVFRSCFTHEISVKSPDKDQRLLILSYLTETLGVSEESKNEEDSLQNSSAVRIAPEVSLESLATRTAGRTVLELKSMLANAGVRMVNRLMEEENDIDSDCTLLALTNKDINDALEDLPTTSADIGAPKIPNVYWKDVGGLGHAKDEIMDMIQLPLEHPELFASGVRQRSGLLLYGPPGTGKTLIAKAVATECSLNFISVKGPELLDMYIGESERKVRQVFESARSAKPCVLFFDELDSLAPQRGRGADSGGVMDRVVSQLLTEIDGMQGNSDVFVIGATNRPDLLDQSLLRPGRFDRLIYLGISKDKNAQLKIMKAITRKYKHSDCVDFNELLDKIGGRLTGADFYALCSGAMANALKRKVETIQNEISSHNANIKDEFRKMTPRKRLADMSEEELTPYVSMADYLDALDTTVPSVSEEELQHYESLREKFSSLSQT